MNIFNLHIMTLYHALMLVVLVAYLRSARWRLTITALLLISFEGVLCVLFADQRFLPVKGIRLYQLSRLGVLFITTYLLSFLTLLICAYYHLRWYKPQTVFDGALPFNWNDFWNAGKKVLLGLVFTGTVLSIYALYCRSFY